MTNDDDAPGGDVSEWSGTFRTYGAAVLHGHLFLLRLFAALALTLVPLRILTGKFVPAKGLLFGVLGLLIVSAEFLSSHRRTQGRIRGAAGLGLGAIVVWEVFLQGSQSGFTPALVGALLLMVLLLIVPAFYFALGRSMPPSRPKQR